MSSLFYFFRESLTGFARHLSTALGSIITIFLSLLIIGLYAFIVVRGLSRALRLRDPFEQTAAAGLFMLIGLQACINVAVNLNLIPTKGMTLPFISYGGSSMAAMGLTMGFALALTRRRPGAYEPGASLIPRRRLLP